MTSPTEWSLLVVVCMIYLCGSEWMSVCACVEQVSGVYEGECECVCVW